jgi:chromosome segregation ATPase
MLMAHWNNSEAQLTVELANEGVGAFKPNVFGDTIFITRTIKKKGGGSYQISGRKQEDKILFTNKKAVDEILEYFHIQVTNPIVILSQVLYCTVMYNILSCN